MSTSQTLAARILAPVTRSTAEGLARLGLQPDPGRWEDDEASGPADAQRPEERRDAPTISGHAPPGTAAPARTSPVHTSHAPAQDTRPAAAGGAPPSPSPGPAAAPGYRPLPHPPFDGVPAQRRSDAGTGILPTGPGAPDPAAAASPLGSRPAATGTGASSATARRPGLSGSPSKTARAEGYAPLSTGDAARVEARSTHIPKAQAAAGTVAQPLPGGQAETTGYQPPRNEPPNRQNQRQSPASPDTVPIGGHVPPQPGAKGAIVPRAEPGSLLAAPREGAALRALPPGYVPVPDRDTRAGTASPPAARAPVPGATADWPGAMPRVVEEAAAPAPGLIPVRPAAPAETGPLAGQARPRSAASQPATARPASERAEPVGQAPAPAPRQAEAPLDPAFGDLADWPDDNAPVGGPRLRNTINVTVAMNGGAPDAALSGMADPATREALRDALTEILRDGARRQGIAL